MSPSYYKVTQCYEPPSSVLIPTYSDTVHLHLLLLCHLRRPLSSSDRRTFDLRLTHVWQTTLERPFSLTASPHWSHLCHSWYIHHIDFHWIGQSHPEGRSNNDGPWTGLIITGHSHWTSNGHSPGQSYGPSVFPFYFWTSLVVYKDSSCTLVP
jgi:hypothetical protein